MSRLPRDQRPPAVNRMRGTALIVGLLILLVITVIGLASMRSTLLEERMAGAMRDRIRAFEGAEAALRYAEEKELTGDTRPLVDNSRIWAANAPDPNPANATPWWFEPAVDASWWAANALPHSLSSSPSTMHYIIEELQFVPDAAVLNIGTGVPPGRWFYRVTARATGADSDTEVLLQTTYAQRF